MSHEYLKSKGWYYRDNAKCTSFPWIDPWTLKQHSSIKAISIQKQLDAGELFQVKCICGLRMHCKKKDERCFACISKDKAKTRRSKFPREEMTNVGIRKDIHLQLHALAKQKKESLTQTAEEVILAGLKIISF